MHLLLRWPHHRLPSRRPRLLRSLQQCLNLGSRAAAVASRPALAAPGAPKPPSPTRCLVCNKKVRIVRIGYMDKAGCPAPRDAAKTTRVVDWQPAALLPHERYTLSHRCAWCRMGSCESAHARIHPSGRKPT